jgi:hypothetical protein
VNTKQAAKDDAYTKATFKAVDQFKSQETVSCDKKNLPNQLLQPLPLA